MESVILQNHIALTSSNHVKQICKPLEKLGITYFSFVRSYKEGTHIRLSNNPNWTKHYYMRGFYNIVIEQIPDSEGNLLWSNVDRFPLFYEASEYYDIDNGTVLILNYDEVTERYFFGSIKKNTSVNHLYNHHLDLFKKFILYFKDSAKLLIEQAEKSKINTAKDKKSTNNCCNDENLVDDFLNEIKTNKICIRFNNQDYYISQNEAKILALLKSGQTSKEISNEIGLSKKTIEIYRDKLKNRLQLYSKSNLVALAQTNSLLDIKLLKETRTKL